MLLLIFVISFNAYATTGKPLPANEVFHFTNTLHDANTIIARWQIKSGYFLYKNRIKIELLSQQQAQLGPLNLPKGQLKYDALQGTYEILRKEIILPISILGLKPGETQLKVRYQGCSDEGFCYPPTTELYNVSINPQLTITAITPDSPLAEKNKPTAVSSSMMQNTEHLFLDASLPLILLSFFGFGLLLSFTPCVLPMIPILSGIIIGQTANVSFSSRKAFFLSLTYVLSMSLTYTIIGIVTALVGHNLQVMLQQPWALAIASGLFTLLAFSMFGFFDIRLPVRIENKLAQYSRRQQGGTYISTAVMGCIATLLLSPCVTAPLVGALTYIANKGNLFIGGSALFCLSLGMGIPLLLISTSAAKFLPKTGPWMNTVKTICGILLLILAISLLQRVIPGISPSMQLEQTASNNFQLHQTVTKLEDARNALVKAKQLGKRIMIDFYADWCASCKVMERTVLQKSAINHALNDFYLLKIDITAVNTATHDLLKYFNVVAPPTYIFYDNQGNEVLDTRIVGEVSSEHFLQQVARVSGK